MRGVKHICTLAHPLVWREAGGLWGDKWQTCAASVREDMKRNPSVRKCTGERVMRMWRVMWADTGASVYKKCSGQRRLGDGELHSVEKGLGLQERWWLKNGALNDMYHLNSRGWRIKNTCQHKLLIWVGVGVGEQQCSRSDVGIWNSCMGKKFLYGTGTHSTRCTESSCESLV